MPQSSQFRLLNPKDHDQGVEPPRHLVVKLGFRGLGLGLRGFRIQRFVSHCNCKIQALLTMVSCCLGLNLKALGSPCLRGSYSIGFYEVLQASP